MSPYCKSLCSFPKKKRFQKRRKIFDKQCWTNTSTLSSLVYILVNVPFSVCKLSNSLFQTKPLNVLSQIIKYFTLLHVFSQSSDAAPMQLRCSRIFTIDYACTFKIILCTNYISMNLMPFKWHILDQHLHTFVVATKLEICRLPDF